MNYQKHKSEESVEDYLETILLLGKQMPQVRSVDVANELNGLVQAYTGYAVQAVSSPAAEGVQGGESAQADPDGFNAPYMG